MNLKPVVTQFYRYIDGAEVQYSYTTYDMWCFLTRIRSYVHRNFANSVEPKLVTIEGSTQNEDRYVVILEDGISPIRMSPAQVEALQAAVDEIQKHNRGYALIFDAYDPLYDYNMHRIPKYWIHQQMQYLSLPHNIPHMYHDGRIYLYLQDRVDYQDVQNIVNSQISMELKSRYHSGYIFSTNPVSGLVPVSEDGFIQSIPWNNDTSIPISPLIMNYVSQQKLLLDNGSEAKDLAELKRFLNSPQSINIGNLEHIDLR